MHTTMRMTTRMTIHTMATTTEPLSAAALLGLFQLTSPALPVGAFSYSDGLESAVARGWVTDESSVQTWLSDGLTLTLSRCDWPLLSRLHEAWSQGDVDLVLRWNAWHVQTRETAEFRMQALQMGHAMLQWLANHPAAEQHPLARLPVHGTSWVTALALAHVVNASPLSALRLSHGFAWLENQVQAAMKAVPLGQKSGQRLLHALARELVAAHEAFEALPEWPQPISAAPGLAILSAQHEHLYTRIFRS